MALRRMLKKNRLLVTQRDGTSLLASGRRRPTPTQPRRAWKHSHKHGHHFDADTPADRVESSLSVISTAVSTTHKGNERVTTTTKSASVDDDNDSDGSTNSGNGKTSNFNGGNPFGGQKNDNYKSSGGNNGGNNNNNNNNNSNKFNNSKLDGSPCEVVNDNDGRLQYTGIWVLESKDPNGIYYTTHTTSTGGSQVSIAFNGTSITIVGIVHASNDTVPPAVASYTIDDNEPLTLPLPISNRDIPNQQFFESPNLPLTTHKLVVNITSDGSPYTLDTLLICSKAVNPVSAVFAPTPSAAARHNLPRIVGGVVSGVAVLLFLALGIVLLHRRRRKTQAARTMNSPIRNWLQRQTLFTSSESIMRNNPSNPSTLDPYDKLSAAEKAPSASAPDGLPDSNVLPASPEAAHTRPAGSAASVTVSVAPRRESDNSSWLLPVLSLDSESLSEKMSGTISFRSRPEAYKSLPPQPRPPMS